MASLAFRRYAALAYGLPVSALIGCAAEPPNAPVAAAPALAANAVQGTQLVPVKLQYQITTVVDRAVIRSQATRRITVAPSTWKGTPTWRVTATRDLRGAFPSDTLEIDRTTLAPLAAHSRHDGTGFGFSYAVDVPQGTVEMWLRDREGRLVKQWTDQVPVAGRGPGPFLLPIAFRALPLAAGWTASFEVFESWFLGPYVRTDSQSLHRVTADIQVDGEERVQVPAGTFDCWRVRVQRRWTGKATGSPDPEVVWVSKRDGWIVKTQSTHGTGDDAEDRGMTLVSVQ